MKRIHLLLLAVLSAVLFWLSWPERGFPLLLFFAFVPLLFVEDFIFRNPEKFKRLAFFRYAFLTMMIWNLVSTFWIYFSTGFGMVMAVFFNAVFMATALSLFHFARKKLKHPSAYISFVVFWIAYEHLHLDWDLSWPWLNLGNGFASYPKWIQWYEYTGTFGGTLWVLVGNLVIFKAVKNFLVSEKKNRASTLLYAAAADTILIPIIISLFIWYNYEQKGDTANVVVVQPNIDPYNEKFDGLSSEEQIAKFLKLARTKVTYGTDLLIGPETAIPEGVWEDRLDESRSVDSLKKLMKKFPGMEVLIGLSSYKMFLPGEEISATARQYPSNSSFYDAYNAAIFIDTSNDIGVYHKSKLVPGVEKMPFPKLLKPLEKFALDLGGTVGSLGIQDERTVFKSKCSKIKAAPVICYESIYGEFVSEYVKNGANLICIMTNDGWWENTPGHRQHLSYARIRAIENRRTIARSANTGISCFIDQKGQLFSRTSWWTDDAIGRTVFLNDELTFYAKYGDYIGRLTYYIALLTLAYLGYILIIEKIRKRKSSIG